MEPNPNTILRGIPKNISNGATRQVRNKKETKAPRPSIRKIFFLSFKNNITNQFSHGN
jgi:hypothetical protein